MASASDVIALKFALESHTACETGDCEFIQDDSKFSGHEEGACECSSQTEWVSITNEHVVRVAGTERAWVLVDTIKNVGVSKSASWPL